MSELINRRGVAAVQLSVNKIGWFFREQPISDQGVDAIVEDVTVDGGESGARQEEGTGRLLALQIKGGASWFKERSPAGWWFRFDASHARRWLNLAIPVVVVLVDPDTDVCYWQEVSSHTFVEAGQSFKVEVPAVQTVVTADAAWQVLASVAAEAAAARYDTSLDHVPPSVRAQIVLISEHSEMDAQLLVYNLAEGRHNPHGTVQALLTARPLWVTRHKHMSWEAIGLFAGLHERPALAADAFELAANAADEASEARYLATAALQLIDVDRPRAWRLFDQAEACGARPEVVTILRSLLNHPVGDASPIQLPDNFDTDSEQATSSAFIQSALAIRSQHAGDVRAALRHSGLALAADPDNSTAMAHRAEILIWSARVRPESDVTPLREGIDLLRQALTQRHEWDGPSLDLTIQLAQTYVLEGHFHATLDICLAAPDGTATTADASNPRVQRLALAAADGVAHRELAHRIAAAMGDNPADSLARYRAGLLTASLEQVRTWLRADLDDAIDEENYFRIAQAGQSLASLGVDTSAILQPYVDRAILPADTAQFLSALAISHDDLDLALPQLRAFARTSVHGAAALLGRLRDASRTGDALALCDQILAQRRDPATIVARVEILIAQQDLAAEQAAVDAVSELEGFSRERRKLLTFAAGKAAERADWVLASQRLQAVLALPGSNADHEVWRLVLAHLNTGRADRARAVIDHYQPETRTRDEAGLWLRVHAATGLDAAKAAQALALAEELNDPEISTALLSLIITATSGLDTTNDVADDDDGGLAERRRLALTAVPGALHVQAFQSLNRLIEEHGEATGVTVLHGEPEDLAAQVIELLKSTEERDNVIADLVEQAQRSQLPIGFVTALTRRSYSTALVERAFAVLPAASADVKEHDLEVDTAAANINGRVVADASSLLTAGVLDRRDTVATFSNVFVAPGTLRDIYRAGADIRGAAGSLGGMGYDHGIDTAVITTLSAAEYLRRLQRVELLATLATALPVRSVAMRTSMPEFADKSDHDAWTEPIELARELGWALWSDDLGMRRMARSVGVDAFGTPALLTASNEHQLHRSRPDEIHLLVESAAAEFEALAMDRIVDLRLDRGAVLRLAQQEGWRPGAGSAVLSRPSWWAWTTQWWQELTVLFAGIAAQQPQQLRAWQEAAILGAARAFQEPTVRSQVICAVVVLGRGGEPLLDQLREGFDVARAVTRRLGFPDPASGLLAVADALRRVAREPDRDRVADALETIARE